MDNARHFSALLAFALPIHFRKVHTLSIDDIKHGFFFYLCLQVKRDVFAQWSCLNRVRQAHLYPHNIKLYRMRLKPTNIACLWILCTTCNQTYRSLQRWQVIQEILMLVTPFVCHKVDGICATWTGDILERVSFSSQCSVPKHEWEWTSANWPPMLPLRFLDVFFYSFTPQKEQSYVVNPDQEFIYCRRKIKGSQNKWNGQREVAKASPFYAAAHMMLHLSQFQSVSCGLEIACWCWQQILGAKV